MRVFKRESIWDKKAQTWADAYSIDGDNVDFETYEEQLRVEELATEEDYWVDVLCDCCQCDKRHSCNDYTCTCGQLEYGDEDNGEISDEEYEIDLVEEYVELLENNTCEVELRNILFELLQEGIDVGYERAKNRMLDFLVD